MTAAISSASGLLQQRPFALFWLARLTATIGYHMLAVTIGWQIYELTNSAFDLGLVGLIQFVPAVVLTLLIGHAADRYDRRLIVRSAQGIYAFSALVMLVALFTGILSRDLLFVVVFLIGTARAFEMPTAHATVPSLVPEALVPRAIAAWSSANQIAVICGPALGGLLYTVSPRLVCAVCLVFFTASITLVMMVRITGQVRSPERPTWASVLAGFEYIRTRQRLLGVITLDLIVVILGGVTALLPIYARDILEAGPTGLGLLRSAPAAGALITTIILSRTPVERHIGHKMFVVVALYGVATIVFGISGSLPLSMFALAVLGASDALSVIIRFSLVQIETPDAMRGRVSAINYLFVGSSNTLGEFRAGVNAAWLGAVPSVLIGGIGSLLAAGLWMLLFPDLRRIDRFEPADKKGT